MISIHFLPDDDECAVKNGGCSQTCINSAGGYQCTCKSGFRLAKDKKTCKGESDSLDGRGGKVGTPPF